MFMNFVLQYIPMQGYYRIWFLLLCSILGLQALDGQAAQLQREIGEIIRYEANIDFSVVPGVLVGVMDGDSVYVCSYGEKLSPDSIYELGSLTKPIVVWLTCMALDSLGWSRDVSVCRFLPDSLCEDNWSNLTVDQVVAHRSGLPRVGKGFGESESKIEDPYADYDLTRLSNDLGEMEPIPGEYSYSQMAYSLLSWLFQKVGGIDSFAHHRFIDPYGLRNTGWTFADGQIAQGHGLDGRVQPPWHFDALLPSMGLKSSMSDLLKIMKLIWPQLILDAPPLTPSLKRELKALAKAGEYMVLDGWFIIQSRNELIFYHTGRTGGHQVSIAFLPEKEKGVVVISNGALGSNELSLLVLDMIIRAK